MSVCVAACRGRHRGVGMSTPLLSEGVPDIDPVSFRGKSGVANDYASAAIGVQAVGNDVIKHDTSFPVLKLVTPG